MDYVVQFSRRKTLGRSLATLDGGDKTPWIAANVSLLTLGAPAFRHEKIQTRNDGQTFARMIEGRPRDR